MDEYIKRDSLIEHIHQFAPENNDNLVYHLILKEPAVDVISVRCKDCRFYVDYGEDGCYCEMLDCNPPSENFYCRDAVKRECESTDEKEMASKNDKL